MLSILSTCSHDIGILEGGLDLVFFQAPLDQCVKSCHCVVMEAINLIRDEHLDLLETLQEHHQEMLDVLITLITSTGIRKEDLQTVLMQYCGLRDVILSMINNLDVVKEKLYTMHELDDDELDEEE